MVPSWTFAPFVVQDFEALRRYQITLHARLTVPLPHQDCTRGNRILSATRNGKPLPHNSGTDPCSSELRLISADGYRMSAMRPDLRTPVMTIVDLSWQDAAGTIKTLRACIEDKSIGGACLRVKSPFDAGTKLRIQWRFEQFSGTVKYCRSDGHEYLVGIQRDSEKAGAPAPTVVEDAPSKKAQKTPVLPVAELPSPKPRTVEIPDSRIRPSEGRVRQDRVSEDRVSEDRVRAPRASQARESSAKKISVGPSAEIAAKLIKVSDPAPAPQAAVEKFVASQDSPPLTQVQSSGDTPRRVAPPTPPPAIPEGRGQERKTMASKWFGLAAWRKQPDDIAVSVSSSDGLSKIANRNASIAKETPMAHETVPRENNAGHSVREVPAFQVELAPVEEIYQTAGIQTPRKGYSVVKVVEMLNSQHLRGLSTEMKRAAVLMALDAAGVSVDQVHRDAKLRQDALDIYETGQKKRAEVEWARKDEENILIRAELESLKAHYSARIERGMEAIARDKSRFNEWSTKKELESKAMAEALDLCLRSETVDSPIAEPTAAPPLASAASGS